jgi:hypothetical protein
VGDWVYALVEYDLMFDPLQATRSQVVTDFMVDHMSGLGDSVNMIEVHPWELLFDDLVGNRGARGWLCHYLTEWGSVWVVCQVRISMHYQLS